jgi:hypothetical protein
MEVIVLLIVPLSLLVASAFNSKDKALKAEESQKEQKVIALKEEKVKEREVSKEQAKAEAPSEKPVQMPTTIAKLPESTERLPFKYKVDVIEGTINHYVSVELIPREGRSVVEIRQRVEKPSLMSEFVKVKAYFSTKPEIYQEFSIPPADYRNNTAIIRLSIERGYELYKVQYSVRGPFKEPEVIHLR